MEDDLSSLKKFFGKQKQVRLAYLYGSAAIGNMGKLSDIDLAVYVDDSLSKEERFNLQLSLISGITGIMKTDKVDLAIMNDAPLSLRYEIIKANHPLYVRDEGERIDIEHHILSRYLDRRFYEKRWAAEFLRRVAKRGI